MLSVKVSLLCNQSFCGLRKTGIRLEYQADSLCCTIFRYYRVQGCRKCRNVGTCSQAHCWNWQAHYPRNKLCGASLSNICKVHHCSTGGVPKHKNILGTPDGQNSFSGAQIVSTEIIGHPILLKLVSKLNNNNSLFRCRKGVSLGL